MHHCVYYRHSTMEQPRRKLRFGYFDAGDAGNVDDAVSNGRSLSSSLIVRYKNISIPGKDSVIRRHHPFSHCIVFIPFMDCRFYATELDLIQLINSTPFQSYYHHRW